MSCVEKFKWRTTTAYLSTPPWSIRLWQFHLQTLRRLWLEKRYILKVFSFFLVFFFYFTRLVALLLEFYYIRSPSRSDKQQAKKNLSISSTEWTYQRWGLCAIFSRSTVLPFTTCKNIVCCCYLVKNGGVMQLLQTVKRKRKSYAEIQLICL